MCDFMRSFLRFAQLSIFLIMFCAFCVQLKFYLLSPWDRFKGYDWHFLKVKIMMSYKAKNITKLEFFWKKFNTEGNSIYMGSKMYETKLGIFLIKH